MIAMENSLSTQLTTFQEAVKINGYDHIQKTQDRLKIRLHQPSPSGNLCPNGILKLGTDILGSLFSQFFPDFDLGS
jgi:hypothetical protein